MVIRPGGLLRCKPTGAGVACWMTRRFRERRLLAPCEAKVLPYVLRGCDLSVEASAPRIDHRYSTALHAGPRSVRGAPGAQLRNVMILAA